MGVIRVLPESIANKIAAGEVVERPASVVKELVENSLDAGAASIEIDISHGGKSLIRISDNGSGMSRHDARTAFERHATSKISREADLTGITSLGFRGEALPSIAAVSRIRLFTGIASEPLGTEIQIDGGVAASPADAPARRGTMIEVRDLFFNTPARRKFLRTDTTEMGHVLETVSHLAFSHCHVRMLLRSDKTVVLDLVPVQDPLIRAQAILGAETAKHLLPIEHAQDPFKLSGLIGKPFVARANRRGQRLFVNRRWIKSLGLSYALQDGYHGLLTHGQYPLAVLFLEVDPQRVDVNVHPTKQEVRISQEPALKSFLRDAVVARLRAERDLAPHLQQQPLPWGAGTGTRRYGQDAGRRAGTGPSVTGRPGRVFTIRESSPVTAQPQVLASLLPDTDPLWNEFRITRLLGQLHRMLILAETESGFILVDQHAAHERVMFEALLKNVASGKAERQSLLVDAVLDVHPRQSELLTRSLPLLAKVGFEIEPFGERSFVVRAYPSAIGQEDPVTFLSTFLDEKEAGKLSTALERKHAEIAALIACKRKSVKAREALSPDAIRTLLTRLSACDNPFTCPHGRPTLIKHTLAELERQFKRK